MTHPARKLTDAGERFARARRLDPRAMPIRIVIADADTATRQRLRRALGVIDARVDEAGDGAELERLLGEDGPFDLVITSSQLPQQSGLSVLTRVRSRGLTTPFVVVSSVHDSLMRVFVSDAEGTVLSSRVVDPENLRTLALNLVDNGRNR